MKIKRFLRWVLRKLFVLFIPNRLSILHLVSWDKREREELDKDNIDQ